MGRCFAVVSRLAALVALVSLGGSGCGKSRVHAPMTVWHDLPSGEAIARREHRPALLFFMAEWSTADKMLEHETFPHPDVSRAMEGLVAIRVDMSDDERKETQLASARFEVKGVPTILVIDDFDAYPRTFPAQPPWSPEPAADLLRVNEFVEAPKLARMIREAKGRAADRSRDRAH
ncbi:MAG: thioredoxin family protein [Deltaproteobacteria bacterium]|nr:thioredoxin family protein [Deltaproteobacteria bacterium]